MSEADVVAVILWAGLTLYAVFGGADFGGGFWDLTAGDAEKGAPLRELIDRSLTPVWEANHVWLIFVLVVAWTSFPEAFGAVMSTLFVPLSLAAFGIVLRGAGFAFRHSVRSLQARRAFGAMFALSSVITPFFMGAAVGAIAGGHVPLDGNGDLISSWLNLTGITVGVLFVATGAFISAVFLVYDARREGEEELEAAFARRALGASIVAGVVSILGLVVLHEDARQVYDGLTSDALPLVILSVLSGGVGLWALATRRVRLLRPIAVAAVTLLIWAWGVAQSPDILPGAATIDDVAAPSATLTSVIVVFCFAVAIVGPSLVLLYTLQRRAALEK
jgi:cytochrome bd ubiquinol oxidase subunit II